MTIYSEPKQYGLEQLAMLDYSDQNYCFDMRVVWTRKRDSKVLSARDSGCSCPSPFENTQPKDLQEVESVGWLKEEIEKEGFRLKGKDIQRFLDKVERAVDKWKASLTAKERKDHVGIGLTLGRLIDALSECDSKKVLPKGFSKPHSWRGIYEELAFEPAENVTVGAMLADAQAAVGKTYQGWKGGDYTMTRDTAVHVSFEGESYDYLGDIFLFYMLGAPVKEMCDDCGRWYKSPIPENHTKVECLENQLADAKAKEQSTKKRT